MRADASKPTDGAGLGGCALWRAVERAVRLGPADLPRRCRLVLVDEQAPPVEGDERAVADLLASLLWRIDAQLPPPGQPTGAPGLVDVRIVTRPAGDGGAILEVRAALRFLSDDAPRAPVPGRIEVERAPAGHALRLVLPRVRPVPSRSRSQAPHPVAPLLIVDDEPHVAESLAFALDPLPTRVAGSLEEAVAALASEAVSGVVCDLRLGEDPGTRLLDHVRAHHPALVARFAFMTGAGATGALAAELDQAGVPVLMKVGSGGAFLSQVAALVAG